MVVIAVSGVNVSAAIVEVDVRALLQGVSVTTVDAVAVHGEADQGRVVVEGEEP